jgi:ABC-type transport system involved in multi-copper enzyme maturation permease subunit
MNQTVTPNLAQLAAGAPQAAPENWPAQTWRLTRWTLFAVRRRALSKWVVGIFFGLYVVAHLFILIAIAATVRDADGAENPTLGVVTFPTSLSFSGGFVTLVGAVCIAIVAGAAVGGEYGTGTVRVWLSRGVGRAQMVIAQALALGLIAFVGSAAMLALAALIGLTLGPALGGSVPGLPGGFFGEALSYWVAVSLGAFAYGLLALLFATLAHSAAAGIGVPLGYFFLEGIVSSILFAIGTALQIDPQQAAVGRFIAGIPMWLLGNNIGALTSRSSESPVYFRLDPREAAGMGPQGQIDLTHALVVVVVYCAAFVALSCVVLRKRDITD